MKKNYIYLKKAAIGLCFSGLLITQMVKGQIIASQTFSYTGGMISYTVPPICPTTATIEVRGAEGGSLTSNGNYSGGMGAIMIGEFPITGGQVLNIMVGGRGNSEPSSSGGGGGSGVGVGNTPWIVAGGGAGVDFQNSGYLGIHAVTTPSGVPGSGGGNGAGGVSGSDGGDVTYSSIHTSRGGRGWNTNSNGSSGQNGVSPTGLTSNGTWGIGGGGGSVGYGVCNCGGGGGGYSGGGSGGINNSGGGGGSYNSGTNQNNTAGSNTGNGLVIITFANNTSGISVSSSNTLGICAGGSVTLTASGALSYTWSTNSNAASIVVSPTVTTAYTLLGLSVSGCVAGQVVTVPFSAQPNLTVSASNTFVCLGQAATLTVSGASSYTWSNNAMTSSVIIVSPSVSTIYTVTGTAGEGCSGTSMFNIDVDPLTLAVPANTAICIGKQIILTANGANAGTYSWADANGPSPFQTISPTPTISTTYTASGVNSNNCQITAITSVTVNPNPTVTASASQTLVCKNKPVTLTAGGATNYLWGVAAGNAATASATVIPAINTTYNYSVTGTDANGCIGTANVVVKAELCTGIDQLTKQGSELIIYPNPNHGHFTIKAVAGSVLTIVNELGQQIKTFVVPESNEVSITGLAKGIYFVTGENNGINKKLVVD